MRTDFIKSHKRGVLSKVTNRDPESKASQLLKKTKLAQKLTTIDALDPATWTPDMKAFYDKTLQKCEEAAERGADFYSSSVFAFEKDASRNEKIKVLYYLHHTEGFHLSQEICSAWDEEGTYDWWEYTLSWEDN